MRIAILISGRGSNMLRLADFIAAQALPVEIALVASNKPCDGIDKADQRGLSTAVFERKAYGDKASQEQALGDAIAAANVDYILLAGYMAILGADFVDRFANKTINIHPSLLPDFKGLDTHERALSAGVTHHGVSIHLVTAALDDGPILTQAALPIARDDTSDSLAGRVLTLEHALYPFVLAALSHGDLAIDGDTVHWRDGPEFLAQMPDGMAQKLLSTIIWPT